MPTFILSLTFSPGLAPMTGSSLIQTPCTSARWRVGMTSTRWPAETVPWSTLPSTIVPRSWYRSSTDMTKGAAGSRWLSTSRESSAPSSVACEVRASPASTIGRHQGHTSAPTSSLMLAPVRPEMGMKSTSFFTAYPQVRRNGRSFVTHSSNRPWSHSTVGSSILLITTMSLITPSVLASRACSRVCPPFSNPVSNSPLRALITRMPTSAWAAPEIMLGT
mmetsp:Transcript_25379/g.40086  ORF Transcript_25379/g.40086 Transcript_25379/m.40086 type:complete len:220 (-) Transcript_25379:1176-1835(-)